MAGKIISIGTALPGYCFKQEEILEFMKQAYDNATDNRKLSVLFRQSGIQKRYSVLPDFGLIKNHDFFHENASPPDIETRMDFYKNESVNLAIDSIHNTLIPVDVNTGEITHLITVTCTGLHAPGLSAEIIEKLGLREDIPHSAVNFLGCNAAFYALKTASLIAYQNPEAKILIVSVELCTLHFRPKNNTDNLLSNTIFGDGAASVLVTSDSNGRKGLMMQDFYSLLLFNGKNLMGWNVNPLSFEMVLNAGVPAFIGDEIHNIIDKASIYYQTDRNEIHGWAIHPGGKKILDEIRKKMNFTYDELAYSYQTLNNFGNMSSPTILFVLKKYLEAPVKQGEKILCIGFGPGLSIETTLFHYG